MKILEPISYLEVAGKPRNRPEKNRQPFRRERGSGERREKILPKMETSEMEVSLNKNSLK